MEEQTLIFVLGRLRQVGQKLTASFGNTASWRPALKLIDRVPGLNNTRADGTLINIARVILLPVRFCFINRIFWGIRREPKFGGLQDY